MKKLLLFGIAALLLATGTAHARTVCFVVTETPYGVEKPAGKILEKLHKGDTLNVEVSELVGAKGEWLPVFTARGGVGTDYLAEGWVYRKHLKAGCRQ